MPFAFIIVGIVLLISGIRGSASSLITLLQADLTGSDNFIYWILAILAIGSLGYIEDFKGLSRAFLALVLIVLVIAEDKGSTGGFFAEFTNAIKSVTSSSTPSSVSPTVASSTTSSGDSDFLQQLDNQFGPNLPARPTS